jgi:hypothetical protein
MLISNSIPLVSLPEPACAIRWNVITLFFKFSFAFLQMKRKKFLNATWTSKQKRQSMSGSDLKNKKIKICFLTFLDICFSSHVWRKCMWRIGQTKMLRDEFWVGKEVLLRCDGEHKHGLRDFPWCGRYLMGVLCSLKLNPILKSNFAVKRCKKFTD